MRTVYFFSLWCSILLPAAVLTKLGTARLLRRYSWLSVFLIIGMLRDIPLGLISPYKDWSLYDHIWSVTLVPFVLAEIALGVSAFYSLARLYRNGARFAGGLYVCGALIGLCLGGLINAGLRETTCYLLFLAICLKVDRLISIILLVSGLTVLLFVRCFPRPLKQMPTNLIVHLTVLHAFWAVNAIAGAVAGTITNDTDFSLLKTEGVSFMLESVCYVVWAVGLRRSGEISERWPAADPKASQAVRAYNNALIDLADRAVG